MPDVRDILGKLSARGSFRASREWRNRQTRWLQVPVPERAWGFNSPLPHHIGRSLLTLRGAFAVDVAASSAQGFASL